MKQKWTIADLKRSKVAHLNQKVFEEIQKPQRKKRVPADPCYQVQWMWEQLAAWSLENGIEVVREHRFHPVRRWRFDFAIPDKKIAIEYEGLMSEKSGHTTLTGYTKDTEKYGEAQLLGWRVIRRTVLNYRKVIKELDKLVNSEQ